MKPATSFPALLLFWALFTSPEPCFSQDPPTISRGTRVRLTLSPELQAPGSVTGEGAGVSKQIIGWWESNSGGVVTVRRSGGDGTWLIPVTSVDRIEVSLGERGQSGNTVLRWMGGLSIGFGILSAIVWEPCTAKGLGCLMEPSTHGQAFIMGAVGGAILAIPIGLMVRRGKHERWREEPFGMLRASLRAAPDGRIGISFTLPTRR